jgi:hypothetical protein
MIQTEKDIKRLVQKARRYYLGPIQVLEDIVSQVICDCFEKKQEVRMYMIRNRCIDRIRQESCHKKLQFKVAKQVYLPKEDEEQESIPKVVDNAIDEAQLSQLEQRILYERFWNNRSLADLTKIHPLAKEIIQHTLDKIKLILEIERIKNEGV